MCARELIGTDLGRYRVLDLVGSGGFGELYVAEDTCLGRKVALKLLPEKAAADRDLLSRFEREGRALAALNHPGIVTVHSVEEAEGLHFITMELVEGRTLTELIPRSGMKLDRLLELGISAAEALSVAHLGVELAAPERASVEARPTKSLEAYQAYLQGRQFATRPHTTWEDSVKAAESYERAVAIDPEFALAWARLAWSQASMHFYRYDLSPERLERAREAAERATELAAGSPRVHLALGYYHLRASRDPETALREIELAERGLPDSADVLQAKAAVSLEGRLLRASPHRGHGADLRARRGPRRRARTARPPALGPLLVLGSLPASRPSLELPPGLPGVRGDAGEARVDGLKGHVRADGAPQSSGRRQRGPAERTAPGRQ